MRGEAGGTLTPAEQSGRALFEAKYSSCHAIDLFTDNSFRNNGLDHLFGVDSGRAHITGRASDVGRFRVPSLRNVALTAPYMHDGRLVTLLAVLAHYAGGVQPSATLDAALQPLGGAVGYRPHGPGAGRPHCLPWYAYRRGFFPRPTLGGTALESVLN